IFQLGYEGIIAIGNDCPEISQINWQEIIRVLGKGKSLIGPNHRNGVYLIGSRKEEFDLACFASLPWQTPGLFQHMVDFFSEPVILETLADINTTQDLYR